MKHYLQRLRSLDRPTPTSWFSFAAFSIVAASVGFALATGAFTPQLDTTPVAGLAWEAESGAIESPFQARNGYVYQRRGTSLSDGGRATYSFTLNESGEYVIMGMVNAANSGSNSFYINVDSNPGKRNTWHIPLTDGFEEREVTWNENQHTFNLGAGEHTIVVVGREGDTRLDRLWLERVGGEQQQDPAPTDPPAEETQPPAEATEPPAEATDPPAEETEQPAPTQEPEQPQQSAPAAAGATAWEAEAGEITAPMVAANGAIYQPNKASLSRSGRAVYRFTTSGAGEFVVYGLVDAPNGGQNSFYLSIDSDPGKNDAWHIPETDGYQERVVTTDGRNRQRVFSLGAGEHRLIVVGREANTRLDRIWIEQVGGDAAITPVDEAPATPAPTEEPAATEEPQDPPASSISAPVYVNAGSCGAVGWSGYNWLADQAYSAGSWGHVGSDYHAVDDSVAGAVSDTNGNPYGQSGQYLHRCQVYGEDFGYHFDLPNGEYTVSLRFAEPVWTAGGQRLFDVVAEGSVVYDNLDVAAAAGGKAIAIERSFTVNVTDGSLSVDFLGNQGGSSDSNAFLNAMSVVAGASAPPVDAGTPEPTPEPTEEPTPEPTQEPTPVVEPGQILYYADVETGDLSQWTGDRSPQTGWSLGGVWLSGSAQAAASRNFAHSGNYSVALTVDGSGGARMARRGLANDPVLPDDAYYSAWYYFPSEFEVLQYNNVFQWKRAFDNTSEPVYSVNIDNRSDGSLYFLLNDKIGDDGGYKTSGWGNQASAPIDIPIGQWVHLECRFRWSTRPDGQVQCWQDGVELWNMQNQITDLDRGDIEHPRQWAVNNYSNGMVPSRVTFYIDDAAISTTRLGPGS